MIRRTISLNNLIDNIIWTIFFLWLVIDSITGYFLNIGTNFPLSQILKLFVLLLVIIQNIRYRRFLIVFICFLLYFILFMMNIVSNKESIILTVTHLSKFISTYCLYIFFQNCIKRSQDAFIEKSYKVINIALFVFIANIILGIMGFGFYTYDFLQLGFKGWFYASNELAGVLVGVIPLSLYIIFINYSRSKYYLASLFFIALTIALGTKAAMLVSILSSGFIPFAYTSRKNRMYFIIFVVSVLVLLLYYIINSGIEIDTITKVITSFEEEGASSLFSDRDEYWLYNKKEFFESGMITHLIGLGGSRTVEMDPFDTLLNYGYLGLFFIYGFYLFLLIKSFICRKNNSVMKVIIFTNLLVFFMSIIAGHIVYSSMAGLYIALINSFTAIKSEKQLFIQEKDNE